MTPMEAKAERVKVRVSAQNMVSEPGVFAQLPSALQGLTRRSLRLQSRILHLDRMVNGTAEQDDARVARRGIDQQFERLRLVYGPAA
jgi:regulator of CtrA degradation